MSTFDLEKFYRETYKHEKSSAISTLKTLMKFLNEDKSTTAIELAKNVEQAIVTLKNIDFRPEVESVAELYFRFITLSSAKFDDFNALKQELARRSKLYMNKVMKSTKLLATVAQQFITDDSVILVHSDSAAVYETLQKAKDMDKHFTVYVTESAPDYQGRVLYEKLKKANFNVTLILDSAIGYIMERIDLVLVGAECVTESGGIINKIGTYPMAICAKAHNKTFYVLAESYKFVRYYPLSQSDIPAHLKWGDQSKKMDTVDAHPLVDYTPQNYITLLMTDLGPLKTPAVCDLLVQLYT